MDHEDVKRARAMVEKLQKIGDNTFAPEDFRALSKKAAAWMAEAATFIDQWHEREMRQITITLSGEEYLWLERQRGMVAAKRLPAWYRRRVSQIQKDAEAYKKSLEKRYEVTQKS